MFDFILGIFEFLFQSWWHLAGVVLGLCAAYGTWHLAASTSAQVELAALAYAFVFIVCIVLGAKSDIPR